MKIARLVYECGAKVTVAAMRAQHVCEQQGHGIFASGEDSMSWVFLLCLHCSDATVLEPSHVAATLRRVVHQAVQSCTAASHVPAPLPTFFREMKLP